MSVIEHSDLGESAPIGLDEFAAALWNEDGSPGWTEDEVWRGSLAAARAKFGVEVAEFLEAIGRALPPRIFGSALIEIATGMRHARMFPPGIGSGEEYMEYLRELRSARRRDAPILDSPERLP